MKKAKTVEKGGVGGSTPSRRAKSPNARGGNTNGNKSRYRYDGSDNEDWALG